jgi:hypothetical protein
MIAWVDVIERVPVICVDWMQPDAISKIGRSSDGCDEQPPIIARSTITSTKEPDRAARIHARILLPTTLEMAADRKDKSSLHKVALKGDNVWSEQKVQC